MLVRLLGVCLLGFFKFVKRLVGLHKVLFSILALGSWRFSTWYLGRYALRAADFRVVLGLQLGLRFRLEFKA